MGRRDKLLDLVAKTGKQVTELVTEAFEEEGTISGAARRLGVYRGTIRYHLRQAGYAGEDGEWTKQGRNGEQTSTPGTVTPPDASDSTDDAQAHPRTRTA